MSYLTQYAEYEFQQYKKALAKEDQDFLLPFRAELLGILKKMSKQKYEPPTQQAVSNMLTSVLGALLQMQPITAIYDNAEEWIPIEENIVANRRLTSLRKNLTTGEITYNQGIVFVSNSNYDIRSDVKLADGSSISSKVKIKALPFTPKTFYINTNVDGENTVVTNETQLETVFNYYDKYEVCK